MDRVSLVAGLVVVVEVAMAVWLLDYLAMFCTAYIFPLLEIIITTTQARNVSSNSTAVDLNWYPPNATQINNLSAVINGTGVHGFIFNSSFASGSKGYNWCSMPHVNKDTYPVADESYTLEYVEVIHRHHKRTPYASNTFPTESDPWYCDDEGLFFYGKPLDPTGNDSSSTYWSVYTSSSNPFRPQGFNGTCQYPQISRGGLDDSWQHGKDLYAVYHDLLGFLPDNANEQVSYRVTNNVITSQVAGMVVNAMYKPPDDFPLLIQPDSIDSLEPIYTCTTASTLYSTYGVGSIDPNWTAHLTASQSLYNLLDTISGVSPTDSGFHLSLDHYFDNLSSRLCHAKPLPCKIGNPTKCITQAAADSVFRLGEYEYSYIYRDAPQSLQASTASYGIWIAELAENVRNRITRTDPTIYRHNIAHDGSIARLLSVLQVDVMVWPGMGAELVFEVYTKGDGELFVRILWSGQILRSSNPSLGRFDMLPLGILLAYFDGLVGVRAIMVPKLCGSP